MGMVSRLSDLLYAYPFFNSFYFVFLDHGEYANAYVSYSCSISLQMGKNNEEKSPPSSINTSANRKVKEKKKIMLRV